MPWIFWLHQVKSSVLNLGPCFRKRSGRAYKNVVSGKIGWGTDKTSSLLRFVNLEELRYSTAKTGSWFLCTGTKLELQAENLSYDTWSPILSVLYSFFPRLSAKRGKSLISGKENLGYRDRTLLWKEHHQVIACGHHCLLAAVPSLLPILPHVLPCRGASPVGMAIVAEGPGYCQPNG